MASLELVYSPKQRDEIEEWRELSYRRDHSIEVFLEWHKLKNILRVRTVSEEEGFNRQAIVPNDKGNDAFTHPMAYAEFDLDALPPKPWSPTGGWDGKDGQDGS